MSALLLLPVAFGCVSGLALLVWSFLEHATQDPEHYREKHIPFMNYFFLTTLCITGVLALVAVLYGEGTITLFHLMEDIPIAFSMDGVSKWFILTVTAVWIPVGFYMLVYFKHEREDKRFFGFYILVYAILLAIDLSDNLVTFYLFYELITLTSFPLVLQNGSKESIMASLKYLFYSMAGAYMGLFGIFVLHRFGGIESFVSGGYISAEAFQSGGTLVLIAVLIMLIGFGTKAGMFPMHAWLPTAHPVAPSPASAVLSGVIVKAGVLGILRTVYYVFGSQNLAGTWPITVLTILSLMTVFMGSLLAFREKVFKKRLAYSTVSQVSYILFGIYVLTPDGLSGALLHVLFHAIVKCGLFLVAGVFLYKLHISKVDDLKGVGKKMPITMWCYTFFALSLVGIPPTGGFLSKWYLAQGALNAPIGALRYIGPAVLLVSALLTAGYLFPITMKGFFPGDDGTYEREEPELLMLLPLIFLAVLSVLLGVFPNACIDFVTGIASLL